jgi:hypothetical protein
VISDKVAGMMKAAPTPWMPRPTMTTSALDARPATTDPAPNTSSPPINASRRPKRSPIAAVASRSPAKTST